MSDGTPDPGTADSGTPDSGTTAEPRPQTRVPLFVTLILAAIVIYCASAGPVLYLTVILHRHLGQPQWLATIYHTAYRPHLDLCYHQEPYFHYLNWFIIKAGEPGKSHADFKEFWEVEAGYRTKQP